MTTPSPDDARPDATQLFVENFQNIQFKDLPPEVVKITKDQVLDFFGVALGGSGEAGVAELRDLMLEWGGAPQSTHLPVGRQGAGAERRAGERHHGPFARFRRRARGRHHASRSRRHPHRAGHGRVRGRAERLRVHRRRGPGHRLHLPLRTGHAAGREHPPIWMAPHDALRLHDRRLRRRPSARHERERP